MQVICWYIDIGKLEGVAFVDIAAVWFNSVAVGLELLKCGKGVHLSDVAEEFARHESYFFVWLKLI